MVSKQTRATTPCAFVLGAQRVLGSGKFCHTPAALPFQAYRDSPVGVVASDNDPNIFNDKEFIVSDAGPGSPKHDNVYATWTRFNGTTGAGVGGNGPIESLMTKMIRTPGGRSFAPAAHFSCGALPRTLQFSEAVLLSA